MGFPRVGRERHRGCRAGGLRLGMPRPCVKELCTESCWLLLSAPEPWDLAPASSKLHVEHDVSER